MHPIIILWAHPRSMSTAFERIMRERGDCSCLHEPFMYYYYVHLARKKMPFFKTEPDRPTSFNGIIAMLQEQSINRPVFSKDMAYYVYPEILKHPELAQNIHHLFLVRDPRKSLISYHKLDPDLQYAEVGIDGQWAMHQWVSNITGSAPLVIQAEKIQADPAGIFRKIWQSTGLSFMSHAFHWNNSESPADWNQVGTWHEKTNATTAIASDDWQEQDLQQEFENLVKRAPRINEYYLQHHQSYEKLLGYSVCSETSDMP